jgi:hypothetical protein
MQKGTKKVLITSGLLAILCASVTQFATPSFAIDISNKTQREPKQPDLIVSWPGHPGGRAAITFRIPREYLHQGTTWVEKDGSIKSFAVQFELPGPIPVQDRPWLKGKKGTPEYEKFMQTWQGRFSMDVGRHTAGGYSVRASMRKNALSSSQLVRDTDIAGLERYSNQVCYEQPYLQEHEPVRNFLAGKEQDDLSPMNCRLDRRWADLFSPPEITADDQGVAIKCMSTGCKAYFNAGGRGIAMGISHKDIENWPRIIEPARRLVNSFIVK